MRTVRDFIRRLVGYDPKKERELKARRERQADKIDALRDLRAARVSAASVEMQMALHRMKRDAEKV